MIQRSRLVNLNWSRRACLTPSIFPEHCARNIFTFLEVIAAPGYSAQALTILTTKKNLRIMRMAPFAPSLTSMGHASRSRSRRLGATSNASVGTSAQRSPAPVGFATSSRIVCAATACIAVAAATRQIGSRIGSSLARSGRGTASRILC